MINKYKYFKHCNNNTIAIFNTEIIFKNITLYKKTVL